MTVCKMFLKRRTRPATPPPRRKAAEKANEAP